MRYPPAAFLLLFALSLSGVAEAQSREDMERCRLIVDDQRRLQCYDAIDLSTSEPRTKYEVIDLGDLKSYALSYRGTLVEVSGWLKPGPDFLFLGIDAADDHPIPIEDENLPRRDRQTFLSICGGGCQATVQGRVSPVNFTTGIIADALIAR